MFEPDGTVSCSLYSASSVAEVPLVPFGVAWKGEVPFLFWLVEISIPG